jgi:hypothetical protein
MDTAHKLASPQETYIYLYVQTRSLPKQIVFLYVTQHDSSRERMTTFPPQSTAQTLPTPQDGLLSRCTISIIAFEALA